MMRSNAFVCLAASAAATVPNFAYAQSQALGELIQQATVAMPIATAPASFLLGATGENVPRLASFREFSTQAARAYDEKGKIANAVAVEVAPALAMGTTSWEDITKSQTMRVWSRTMVSFATKVGSEKAGPLSAVGLQSILWAPAMDSALAMASTDKCRGIINSVSDAPPVIVDGKPKPADISDARKKLAEDCQIKIDGLLTKWNQPMVAIGGGRSFAGTPDTGKPKAKDQSSYWLTAAYGADTGDQASVESRTGFLVTGHLRRTTSVSTTATDSTEIDARQQLQGVNGRYGNSRLAIFAEYSITKSKAAGFYFRDRKRSIIGLEFKLGSEDMYLTLGTARDTGLAEAKQSVLAQFNWGFGRSPTLLPK
jgi:hypothetical protein